MTERLNPKTKRWFDEGNIAAAILGGPGFELIDRNWGMQDRLLVLGDLFEWSAADPRRRDAARRGIESALRIAVEDEDVFAAANIVWSYLITLRHFIEPLSEPLTLVRILDRLPEEELDREGVARTIAAIRGWLTERGLEWPGAAGS